MKKSIQSLLSLGILLLGFSSCKTNQGDEKIDCGEMKTHQITKEYCLKYGLEEEEFTVNYPSLFAVETQEDYRSSNFVSFVEYDEDSMIRQSINLGYFKGLNESGSDGLASNALGTTKEDLMKTLIRQLNSMGLNLQEIEMRDRNILGEGHYTVRAQFETSEDINGFMGDYLIQFIFYATHADHGVLAIMTGRTDSGITNFEDFEAGSCIAPIIQSL